MVSRDTLGRVAFELFAMRGFDETTIDEIAEAAGIGRRTFFRYFPSKNDLPWGDFDQMLRQLAEDLDALPDEMPMVDALRTAVVKFNRVPAEEQLWHRQRMGLLLRVPTLVAYSTLRYQAWRDVVASFAARRLGQHPCDLAPRALGRAALGVALSAYEQWLDNDATDLSELLDDAFRLLGRGFADG